MADEQPISKIADFLSLLEDPTAYPPDPFEETISQLQLSDRSDEFCQQLYGALCNMGWRRGQQAYSCSWRYAGGLIADNDGREETNNYLDYYCSGNEGRVSNEVASALAEHGWYPCEVEVAHALNDPEHAKAHLGQLAVNQWLSQHYPKSGRSFSISEDRAWTIMAPWPNNDEVSIHIDRQTGKAYRAVKGVREAAVLLEAPLPETLPLDEGPGG